MNCGRMLIVVLIMFATPSQAQEPAVIDSSAVAVKSAPMLPFSLSPFDTVYARAFAKRHAFSIDHFLEFVPGLFVQRRGPIGAHAAFSRYGIGRGRARVYLGGVPLNDPQDDRAPLPIIPTTAVGRLVFGGAPSLSFGGASCIEGVLEIREPLTLDTTPSTMIELSKGDHELKQRRVRYSSRRGRAGIDFAYDELRNGGYSFDSRDIIHGLDFGSSSTRVQSGSIRGKLAGSDTYRFGFRRFTSTFRGNLTDFEAEDRRSGHIGLFDARLGRTRLTVFERGYKNTLPDSTTATQTLGAGVAFPVFFGNGGFARLGGGYEDIVSKQNVGDVAANERLQRTRAGFDARIPMWGSVESRVGLDVAHDVSHATGWGARLSLARRVGGRHSGAVEVRRSFRMPNLGEMFLPSHVDGGNIIHGNPDADSEHAFEGNARLHGHYGWLENEVRGTVLRTANPILFGAVADLGGGGQVITAINSAAAHLSIVEERLRAHRAFGATLVEVAGGVSWALGDREGYFVSVPEFQGHASFRIGRPFFKKTSDLFLTTDYQYSGARTDFGGVGLPSFGVVNVALDARLVHAQIYVLWLNVTDREYETVFPYRMTPKTFAFGIAWTLFN